MSIKTKLLALLIAPIIVLSAIHILELQRVISGLAENLAAHKEQAMAAVARNLEGEVVALSRITINLAHPKEIVHAVQAADNEVLYDWSHSFTNRGATVLFADAQGMVLSRAPAEFRFGDDISRFAWFARTLRDGAFVGMAEMDGAPHLVSARCVRKYDDLPVGVVAAAVPVTPQWLSQFTDDRQVLRVEAAGRSIQNAPTPPGNADFFPLDVAAAGFADASAFSVAFLPDPQYQQLVALKHAAFVTGSLTALATIAALVLLLASQLRPYAAIVASLREYARNAASLETVRERLTRLTPARRNELHDIIDALVRMIDAVRTQLDRVHAYAGQLETLAATDALTGLHNRMSISAILQAEKKDFDAHGIPLTVLMLDVDSFKAINDTRGHQTGDAALMIVARALRSASRKQDSVGRWGGEEFLLIAPGLDVAAAPALAERLRAAVAAEDYPDGLRVTASIGMTQSRPGDTVDTLIGRADTALYQAKAAGRNTVRAM